MVLLFSLSATLFGVEFDAICRYRNISRLAYARR